jgi:hypothetical protein
MKIMVIFLVLLLSGCGGLGFNKTMTLMPDQVKLEVDSNPQDGFNSKEITGGFTWNLK